MFRVAVTHAGSTFARTAAADMGAEFPGCSTDIQEFVDGWRSVDAPRIVPPERGFFKRLLGR